METEIGLDRLAVLVDAYGGRSENWPEEERQGACCLLERSAEANRLRDAALELDRWLDGAPMVEPSAVLVRRIMDTVSDRTTWLDWVSRLAQMVWPFGPTWQPATALVVAGVLGVTFGVATFDEPEAVTEDGMVVAEVMLDADDWDDDWTEP